MSHPPILSGKSLRTLAFPFFVILSTGCGLTAGGRLAEQSESESVIDVIAEEVAASESDIATDDEADTLLANESERPSGDGPVAHTALWPATDQVAADLSAFVLASEKLDNDPVGALQQEQPLDVPLTYEPSWRSLPEDETAEPPNPPRSAHTGELQPSSPRTVDRVSKDSFRETVLESDVPVIVDFYADWCKPCKLVAPLLDQVAREETGVRVVKVNIDRDKQLADTYRVKSFPTVILFKEGNPVAHYVGLNNIRRALGQ